MIAYLVGMILIAGSFALLRRDAVARVATVIIVNWIAGYSFNALNGTFTPWAWSLLLDTVSAAIVLWHPAGRWQAVIGLTYAAQVVCHFVFAYRPDKWGQHAYWEALTAIAWAQLVLLFLWGTLGGRGRWISDADIAVRAHSVGNQSARSEGMGK